MSLPRLSQGIALAAVVFGLVACGGGGGGGGDTPAAPGTLGPAAGTVRSSDGKVSVSVGDNALQAPATVSVVPATPDAETAADPGYVAGTTYTYTAPDIQVPDQVVIEIESPAAVSAATTPATALPGRRSALAFAPGYVPPPTCLVNAPSVLDGSQTAQSVLYLDGTACPQAPAPGCIDAWSPTPQIHLCTPSQDVFVVPAVTTCPAGYREVTGEAEFETLANAYGYGRVCQRNGDRTPPTLASGGRSSAINCQPKGGKFVCIAPKLPSGTYSVMWDKNPPADPTFTVRGAGGGSVAQRDELDTAAVFEAGIVATDPQGLGTVEILEVFPSGSTPPAPFNSGAQVGQLAVSRVWQAPASAFSGTGGTRYDSGTVQLPFGSTTGGKRRFMARSFDRAGNSSLSQPMSLDFVVARIEIDRFTVAPASVAFPGGPVTLSWSVFGASNVSIDNGGGSHASSPAIDVSTIGSVSVNVSATTTFTLTATHPRRATKTATVTVTLGTDTTPPTVTLVASPATVVAPGSTTLSASASDNAAVTKVEFWRGTTLLGTDTTAPYTQAVSFTPADAGTVAFTAKAFDAANNSTTSAVVNVSVAPDTTPPSVSLAANPANVLAPGATTLLATASDDIGVTKVEFFRGSTLLATTSSAPFQTTVNLTAADLGTLAFTAKAYDAQNNVATSAAASVVVTAPSSGDTYASPTGTDAGNTTCSQASPCRSIALAAATAAANQTVWLMNGIYDGSTQPAPITVPAGLTLRALTPGQAAIGQQIVLQGNASVVGVVLRRFFAGDWGSIAASAGNVSIDGLKVAGGVVSNGTFPAVLVLSGSVHATLTPGDVTDYVAQLAPAGQATAIYASLAGNAWLTVNGGSFGGAALGGADGVSGAFNRGAFNLTGSSRLDLNNVVLNVDSSGIFMFGAATQVNLNGTLLNAAANSGPGYGIHAVKGTPQITLVNSQITGFNQGYSHNSAGIAVGSFAQPGAALTLSTTNSTLSGNNTGVFVTETGSTASSLTWTGSNVTVSGNTHGGVACRDACSIDLAGSQFSQNATTDPAANAVTFHGGLWLGMANKTYQLKLRDTSITGHVTSAGSNAEAVSNSGVTMGGNASSVFDLGTAASPGNNLIQGNGSGTTTSGLNVNVAAGVTVNAVGNTFAPNVQGANAQGRYLLGTAPCGALSCSVVTGAGLNYRVTGGSLRLAQ